MQLKAIFHAAGIGIIQNAVHTGKQLPAQQERYKK